MPHHLLSKPTLDICQHYWSENLHPLNEPSGLTSILRWFSPSVPLLILFLGSPEEAWGPVPRTALCWSGDAWYAAPACPRAQCGAWRPALQRSGTPDGFLGCRRAFGRKVRSFGRYCWVPVWKRIFCRTRRCNVDNSTWTSTMSSGQRLALRGSTCASWWSGPWARLSQPPTTPVRTRSPQPQSLNATALLKVGGERAKSLDFA